MIHYYTPEEWFEKFGRKGRSWQERRWVVDDKPDTYITDENGHTYGVDIDHRVMPETDWYVITPRK